MKILTLNKIKIDKRTLYVIRSNQNTSCFETRGSLNNIFRGRKSYRGNIKSLTEIRLEQLLKALLNTSYTHPTPICGNLNCITVIASSFNEFTLFNLKFGVEKIQPKWNNLLSKLLKDNMNRSDIKGVGGTYLMFFVDLELVKLKYRDMALPLLFTSVGTLMQSFTILFNYFGIRSCIHFGVINHFKVVLNHRDYYFIGFMRCGYEEI